MQKGRRISGIAPEYGISAIPFVIPSFFTATAAFPPFFRQRRGGGIPSLPRLFFPGNFPQGFQYFPHGNVAVAGNIPVTFLPEAGRTALVAVKGTVECAHRAVNIRKPGGKQSHHRKPPERTEGRKVAIHSYCSRSDIHDGKESLRRTHRQLHIQMFRQGGGTLPVFFQSRQHRPSRQKGNQLPPLLPAPFTGAPQAGKRSD